MDLAGGCGEMERGNEGFVSANLTSELAASSSQNSLPGAAVRVSQLSVVI